MKQYEEYKDSGIQWIGKIPSHWSITLFKRIFSFGRGLSITKADLVVSGIPVISYGQIHSKNNTGTKIEENLLRYVPESYAIGNESSIVKKGDFIFADTSEDLDGCGNCIYNDKDDLIYAGYHSIIAKSKGCITSKYLAYLFKTDCWRSQIRSSVYGVKVFSITQNSLSDTSVILPPLSEQESIASYLDYKVGQIDAVISEKEKMLEDLKVYRSAIISEAVTKGLDKNVKMKDSGIERFPYINRHWRTIKLKYISTIKSGKLLANSELSENGLYEVYGGNGFMGYTSEFNTESPAIVIGRVGALCGNVHLIDSSKWVTDNALVLNIIDDTISYEYLYFYLDAFDLNTLNSSNAQPLITGTKVLDVLMPLPSLDEQQRIAEKIKVKILVIDELINKFNEQISDLKSYKSSLITEAVTGKIDLRGWKK